MEFWIPDKSPVQIESSIWESRNRYVSGHIQRSRIIAIIATCFASYGIFLLWVSVFMVLLWLFCFYFSVNYPSKKDVERVMGYTRHQMEVIEQLRMEIEDSSFHFRELTKADIKETEINPVLLADITDSINNISKKVLTFQKLLVEFMRLKGVKRVSPMMVGLVRWLHSNTSDEFSKFQRNWLKESIPAFTKDIRAFLAHHSQELKTLDESIWALSESRHCITEKWSLDLQKTRLGEHIEYLEKVRAGI